MRAYLLILLLLPACIGESPSPVTDCESCLASGGTWQPEASACTENCALMDISCFEDSCPAACSSSSCGDCFSESDCESNGCTWHAAAEAMWCTAP